VRWFDNWSHAVVEQAAYAEDAHRTQLLEWRAHVREAKKQQHWQQWSRRRARRPAAVRLRVLTTRVPARRVAGQ
jgi:hypothetical protein